MRQFSKNVDIIFIIYISKRNLASNQTLDRHGGDAPLPAGQAMQFSIEASLTYDFPAPCEVLLLIEASHEQGQTVLTEALTFWPPLAATRIDDARTGERRTVFTATR